MVSPCSSAFASTGYSSAALVQLDQRAALRRVVLREQRLQRNLRELRIGVVTRAVLERELLGLDEQVQVLGAAEAHGLEVVALEDVEHLQRRDALPVRRQLPHVVAAVVSGHRLDPFGAVRGQVGRGEVAAVGAHVGVDASARCRPCRTHRGRLRRSRSSVLARRIAEDLALGRRAAVGHEGLGEAGYFCSVARVARPAFGDDLGHRKAVARVGDRRLPAAPSWAACRTCRAARTSRRPRPAPTPAAGRAAGWSCEFSFLQLRAQLLRASASAASGRCH